MWEQILKLWKIQSGQDIEEQGQEDLQPESPREATMSFTAEGPKPTEHETILKNWELFLTSELKIWTYRGFFAVFISPNVLHNDQNEHL